MGIGRELVGDVEGSPNDQIGEDRVKTDMAGDSVLVEVALDKGGEEEGGTDHQRH